MLTTFPYTYSASGLKNTFHGVAFQWKLLMLFAWRLKIKNQKFFMATEMDLAEKFDDVVIFYEKRCCLLQAKHGQEIAEKISLADLLTHRDDRFSLQKYYRSFCKMSSVELFQHCTVKEFIIFTNFGFHFDDLLVDGDLSLLSQNETNLYFEQIDYTESVTKTSGRYFKFVSRQRSEGKRDEVVNVLMESFRGTSDFTTLVCTLAKYLVENKTIGLDVPIFKSYKDALVEYVFDLDNSKLSQNFSKTPVNLTFNNFRKHLLDQLIENLVELEIQKIKTFKETEICKHFFNDQLNEVLFRNVSGPNVRGILIDKIHNHIEKFVYNHVSKLKKSNPKSKVENEIISAAQSFDSQSNVKCKKSKFHQFDESEYWAEMIKNVSVKCSDSFAKSVHIFSDPIMENVDGVVKEFFEKYEEFQSTSKVIQLRRNKASTSLLLKEMPKMVGHVFVKRGVITTFSKLFLSNGKLSGNLNEFRTKLFTLVRPQDLGKFSFKIAGLKLIDEDEFEKCLDTKVSLPDISVDRQMVEKFLDELIFAVDQPNEIELGQLIQIEMKNDLRVVDVELIYNYFQNEILNWIKVKQGADNRFLTEVDVNSIFQTISRKLNQQNFMFSTTQYGEKIFKCGVQFKVNKPLNYLHDFIASYHKLLVVKTINGATFLCIAKIYQHLKSLHEFSNDGDFICIKLWALHKFFAKLEPVLNSEKTKILLVECNDSDEFEITFLNGCLSDHLSRKIILVVSFEAFGAINQFIPNSTSYDDLPRFQELVAQSQEFFLNKILNFQGVETNLRTIGNYASVIDSQTFADIFNSNKYKIGNQVPITYGFDQSYYISRTFSYHFPVHVDIFDKYHENDILVVSHIKHHQLMAILNYSSRVVLFDSSNQDTMLEGKCIVCLDSEHSRLNIADLQVFFPTKQIHHLKFVKNGFWWQQSIGSVNQIVPYRNTVMQSIPESELESFDETDLLLKQNLTIISNMAGLGKTTILTQLSLMSKNDDPNKFVIRINLNDYCPFLNDNKDATFNTPDVAVQFVLDLLQSQEKSKFLSKFECQIFLRSFDVANKMVLFLDGFDEISPDFKNLVISLIKSLRQTSAHQIFLTTRPHLRQDLESNFDVINLSLNQFTEVNKVDFLSKYWSHQIGNQSYTIRLKEYAVHLLTEVTFSLNDKFKDFTGIPLQMRMIAEVFQESSLEWARGEMTTEPEFPDKFDIHQLFHKFIEIKFNVFRKEKEKVDLTNPAVRSYRHIFFNDYIKKHQKLALFTIFNVDGLHELLSEHRHEKERAEVDAFLKFIMEGDERRGIVTDVINNKAHFIHLMFAEYFAAGYLVDNFHELFLERQSAQTFLFTKILLHDDFDVLRSFIDGAFQSKNISASRKFGDIICSLWNDTREKLLRHDNTTFLYRAFQENNLKIAEFVLQCLAHQTNIRSQVLDQCGLGNDTLLIEAVRRKDRQQVKLLIKEGASVNAVGENNETPIFSVTKNTFDSEIFQILLENGADLNSVNNVGKPFLFKAIHFCNQQDLEMMVKFGMKYWLPDRDGRTIFQECNHLLLPSYNDVPEVLKYLVDVGLEINEIIRDKKGMLMLHRAALCGNLNCCKFLIDKGADVNLSSENGDTVLHFAARGGNTELCDYLIRQYNVNIDVTNKIGRTPLLDAGKHREIDAIKWFMKNGANANVCDNNGDHLLLYAVQHDIDFLKEHFSTTELKQFQRETYLHKACLEDNVSLCSWSVKTLGADIDTLYETSYSSALSTALSRKKFKVAKWLIQNGAETIYRNNFGDNPMIEAVNAGQLELCQLLENPKIIGGGGACINVRDINGNSILHLAAKKGSTAICEWLIDTKEINIESRNYNGQTCFMAAYCSNRLSLASWLLEKGANPYATDNFGRNAFLTELSFKKGTFFRLLVETNVIDAHVQWLKDNKGRTLLHCAVGSCNMEIFQWLYNNRGLSLYEKDIDGRTPLHLLAKTVCWPKLVEIGVPTADLLTEDNFGNSIIFYLGENPYVEYEFNNITRFLENMKESITKHSAEAFIHTAASCGSLAVFKHLVHTLKFDINSQNCEGQCSLHIAIQHRRSALITWLIENGADVSIKNSEGQSPLMLAVKNGSYECVQQLLSKGCELCDFDKEQNGLLHYAAIGGNATLLSYILDQNTLKVDHKNSSGITALRTASQYGNIGAFEILLKQMQNSLDANDVASLVEDVLKFGYYEMLELLINLNVECDLGDPKNLNLAIKHHNFDIVQWILAKYFNKNSNQLTELIEFGVGVAKKFDQLVPNNDTIAEVDKLVRFTKNRLVLDGDHELIVRIMSVRGSDVNAQNEDGNTLLHWATFYNLCRTVQLLIALGANVNISNDCGQTPLDLSNVNTLVRTLLVEASLMQKRPQFVDFRFIKHFS